MIPSVVWSVVVPAWLQLGLLAGLVAASLAAVVFAVGGRLFPSASAGGQGDGGEARRRAAIRAYLRDIGEPFEEDLTIRGQPVAFFLVHRDVAITFDARAYFRLSSAGIETILVEHEMPVSHLGWRLPFETPEPETNAPPDGEGPAGAFAALGLSPSASSDEVTAAYRRRVKEVHPDHGGDAESFHRLREAYTAAKRRAE